MMKDGKEISAVLTEVLATMQRHLTALAIASRVEDEAGTIVAAARLHDVIERAVAFVADHDAQVSAADDAALRAQLKSAKPLLEIAPSRVAGPEVDRLIQWARTGSETGTHVSRADLFDLRAQGRDLSWTALARLRMVRAHFAECDLTGCTLDATVSDGCDFTRASLQRSTWRGALVNGCTLRGATLADAVLDGAVFLDCDLRGADLSSQHSGASAWGSVWIRCDLRDSNWRGRSLRNARIVSCEMSTATEMDHGQGLVLESSASDGARRRNQ